MTSRSPTTTPRDSKPLARTTNVADLSDRRLDAGAFNNKCGNNSDDAIWYPESPKAEHTEARADYEQNARRLCAGFPVIAECLERPLHRETSTFAWGIADGLAPRERMRLNRNRMRRAHAAQVRDDPKESVVITPPAMRTALRHKPHEGAGLRPATAASGPRPSTPSTTRVSRPSCADLWCALPAVCRSGARTGRGRPG